MGLGPSAERRTSESTMGERGPDPAAPSVAKEEGEWTTGEVCPMPCSTQGVPAQRTPGTEACLGGDLGSGLRARAEVWGWEHIVPPEGIGARLPASCQPKLIASFSILPWLTPQSVPRFHQLHCHFFLPRFLSPFCSHSPLLVSLSCLKIQAPLSIPTPFWA